MTVDLEINGPVATVRLNRPDRLNALSEEMKEAMPDMFGQVNRDPAIKVVVLCGAGRGFCASGDTSTMGRFTAVSGRERLKRAHRMIIALANIEKPVIASVRGPVAGIGWSMALACDMIVASETAVFSQVFRNVGLSPDGGAIYFLSKVLGELRAKELVYRARKLPAEEAYSLGLVTRLAADAELEATTQTLVEELVDGPHFSFGTTKKMFKLLHSPSLETFLDAEAWAQGVNLMTGDHSEGIQAFGEKRKPVFSGQ
ncbi:enoyl-CoA hydratase/isomerase family protein [Bosea sp. (in: a-proteobacteria)]|jgi:2-(1,2-epoxy-1,2-dihydrophenyl)acetyl-CoA isomerase|uniref:enoyl-CoA hydratase/isomerase family protein n=1 Tax=Bosea sp. (in: a-proteobacteria) TaxID=1871050 RepID=UPI002DDCCE87|nr:enoyl-CoA hydratase-related protein [Bosea sp. (in: a-proteobacteria)]HEV2512104.1 enoyl-CoA hydratase-related protein [Bosea sp. (in: a-proteobacteria)]